MDDSFQPPAVLLRQMTLEDVENVHAIDLLSFSLPWTERSYRFELTENRHSCAWVAEVAQQDGSARLVAMIIMWVIVDEAHVATIAVHPDYRQRGIGRRLLAQGLLAAYEKGARRAFLEVRRSNEAAQFMYRSFGFEKAGERLRYYKDNQEDAFLMTLEDLEPERLRRLAD
jgi:[ribosomal protein S18]-alanine N-acetyltransferase